MTKFELFAFVILPLTIAGLGWAAALGFIWWDRHHTREPDVGE